MFTSYSIFQIRKTEQMSTGHKERHLTQLSNLHAQVTQLKRESRVQRMLASQASSE